MKKYYFLIVVALILGLVLTGCSLLSNVGQVPATDQSGVSSLTKNSIAPICFGFEDLETGEDVTIQGKIWDYLTIDSSEDDLQMQVIEKSKTPIAYNSSGGDNACLEGVKGFGPVGSGVVARPLDTNDIIFEFSPGVTVSTFSINMYDYGDYIHIFDMVNAGEFEVNLNAYAVDGFSLIDRDSYLISGGKNNKYDACDSDGIKVFNVTGLGISKVEIEFTKNIDIGVGFDNICFTPEPQTCETYLQAGNPKNGDNFVGNVMVEYTLGDKDITVNYSTEDPWKMEEIHFHASFGSPEYWGKPVVNKGGNPAPGQFLKVFEDLEGSNSESFTIPLSEIGTVGCGPLYFAAHAKVYKLSDIIPESIVSEDVTSDVSVFEVDPIANPSVDPTSSGVSKIVDFPAWDASILVTDFPLARWIIENYELIPPWQQIGWDPTKESWRRFIRNFELPSNAVNISGELKITADNAEQVLLNSNNIGSNGDWKTINSYTLNSGELIAGNNELDIIVQNNSGGVATVNPTGLIYKLGYQYQLKTEETAWGFGPDFPFAKNWSMYFECPNLVPCPFSIL